VPAATAIRSRPAWPIEFSPFDPIDTRSNSETLWHWVSEWSRGADDDSSATLTGAHDLNSSARARRPYQYHGHTNCFLWRMKLCISATKPSRKDCPKDLTIVPTSHVVTAPLSPMTEHSDADTQEAE